MASVASLNVEIGARIASLQKSLKAAERELRQSGARMSRLGTDITTSLSIPIAALGGSAIVAAGEMESLSLAMQATFKNAGRTVGEANAEVEALRKAALAPGLDFPQAVEASVRLQAVGLKAEDARGVIVELANAVASTGGTATQLSAVTIQLSQMISKGKVMAGDLRIIQENLPIVSDLMQKAFGTSNSEALQDLGVSGKEFVSKITEEMQKLNRVEGGISNAVVNAGSAIKQFLAGIGDEINKAFNIGKAADNFTKALGSALNAFSGLSDGTKRFIIEAGLAVVALGPLLKIMGAIKGGAAQIVAAFGSIVSSSKGLIGSLLSLSGTIGKLKLALGVVGLVVGLGVAVYSLSDSFDAAEFAAKQFSSAQEEIVSQTSQEIGALNKNFDALKDETKSRVEKGKVVDELLRQYPQYLRGIDLESASVSKLTEIQKGLNASILQGVAERQKAAAVTAIYEQQAKILLRIQQIRDGGKVTVSEAGLVDTGEMIRAGGIASAVMLKLQDQSESLGKQVGVVSSQFDKAFGTVARSIDPAIDKEYELRDAYYAERDAQEENLKTSKKHVSSKSDIAAASKAQKDASKALIEAEKEETDQLEKYAKMVREIEQAWRDEAVAAEAGIKNILKTFTPIDVLPQSGQREEKVPTPISDAQIAAFETERNEHAKLMEEFKQAREEAAISIAGSTLDIFGTFSEAYRNQELENLDAEYKYKLAAARGNATKEAQVKQELEKKKENIERNFARRKKALAIIEALINMYVGISKAAASAPPPFNLPAIKAAALIGGAQVTAIAAQQFASGTFDAPGGTALVGEEGPEIVHIPRHGQVFTASQTKGMLNGLGSNMSVHLTGQFVVKGTDLVAAIEQTTTKRGRAI